MMAKPEIEIKALLTKGKKTLAVAESCTGGLLSHLITNVAGSSQYFILGVITYSNAAKTSLLKIPQDLIIKNGAVSRKVAALMAQSVRKLARADFGIGITGIAGPGGGSLKKPIGTVFIAIDSAKEKICQKFYFKGSRLSIKKRAAKKALELLKICLEKN
jgi:nicotinamide-nucleotide amidase